MHDGRIRTVLGLIAAGLIAVCGCNDAVVGGNGGSGDGGSGDGAGGGDVGLPFEPCAEKFEEATNTYQPVDIVFTIDNTPSMLDEIEEVRANMNAFSRSIVDSGLDAHIVVISCLPGHCDNDKWHGICIDPPLGAEGGCDAQPYGDTNPPSYLHVNVRVGSLKGLGQTVETYSQWKSMIRADSTKHFVIVSDDDDEWTAEQFDKALLGLDPSLAGYKLHGIFSYLGKEDACAISSSEPCCTYAAPDGEGTVYKQLVADTGGVSGDLCLQDFDPVFEQVATSVIRGARLSCSWQIPDPPEGETLDPKKINVAFVDGSGSATTFGRVDSSADCDRVDHAWYYDDPEQPTMVNVCPQTCEWIQGKEGAQMRVHFGCETEMAPLN